MNDFAKTLKSFLLQAQEGDLKTAHYPKEYQDFTMKVSFGMGAPARVPWVGFMGEGMTVSRGINPVYLYYKDLGELVLAYGVSETEESPETWPAEVISSNPTIESYFDQKVPRYGDSFVFKSYKVDIKDRNIKLTHPKANDEVSDIDIESDLNTLLDYYRKVLSMPSADQSSAVRAQGLFYMEKQLEDFIIYNWEETQLGKRFDLIIEDGELKSQQYPTDIGRIDILAKDKESGRYVVIELKKDQTSDDTVGQLARYMGWIMETYNVDDVMGVIIAGKYDKKLDYALKMVRNVEVFLYEVDFKLNKFEK
jgi:hypothetical protein